MLRILTLNTGLTEIRLFGAALYEDVPHVPARAAQKVVDQAVAAGVRAILNFAPTQLRVPAHVQLSNVDLAVEVEYLSYSLAE